jgi:hypothetical protein
MDDEHITNALLWMRYRAKQRYEKKKDHLGTSWVDYVWPNRQKYEELDAEATSRGITWKTIEYIPPHPREFVGVNHRSHLAPKPPTSGNPRARRDIKL